MASIIASLPPPFLFMGENLFQRTLKVPIFNFLQVILIYYLLFFQKLLSFPLASV